jgi:hypothetical protein
MSRRDQSIYSKEEAKLGAHPSPLRGFGGASMLSGAEMIGLAHRTFPPADTVEAEFDLGHAIYINRHYVRPTERTSGRSRDVPLAYSDIELKKAKETLANEMQEKERKKVIDSDSNPSVELQRHETTESFPGATTGVSPTTLRYLFDKNRMAYIDRFMRKLKPLMSDENNHLNALLEVCAILYGCDSKHVQEAWLKQFLRLDRRSLNEESEKLSGLLSTATKVLEDKALWSREAVGFLRPDGKVELAAEADGQAKQKSAGAAMLDQLKAAAKPQSYNAMLNEDDEDFVEDAAPTPASSSSGVGELEALPVKVRESLPKPDDFAEYAPLYESYAAFLRGDAARVNLRLGTQNLGAFAKAAERQRWRKLVDRLVSEAYDTLSEIDFLDAINLNDQLQTMKIMELKIGDTVRDAVAQQQATLPSELGPQNRMGPLEILPNNPAGRIS